MNKLPALLSFLLMTAPPGLMAGEPVYGIGDEVRRIITPQGGGGADVARPESGSPEAAVEFRPPLVGDSIAPAEGDLVFGDGDRTLRLRFDVDTGALDLFHAPGIRADAAARSLDVYATAYRGTSSEKDDQVVRRYDQVDLHGRPVVRFVCANAALGCRVTKEYTVDVDHGELAKRITFAGEERRLIFVESATVVPASFRADGYYRVWMEHIGRQRSSFLSASIANDIAPYPSRLDNTRKQPCVLVLNKVTEDAGYGEAVIEVNGIPMPHYTGVGGKAIGTVANLHRVTILTANGWQIPRGMVEVKADRTQTLKWVYRFYRGNYLNYHQDYHQRYYAPGFAPPSRPEKTNLAFDLGNTTPMVVWDEAAGNLVPSDGYRPADPPPGQGRPGMLHWQAMDRFLEELSPDAWGSFVMMESSFMTLGDPLADHLYASYWEEQTPHRRDTWKISYPEYEVMVAHYQEKLPRIRFFRYDNAGWLMPGSKTAEHVPHLDTGFRFKFWYYMGGEQMEFAYARPGMERLMGLPYLRSIALGVYPYDDFDFHGNTLFNQGDDVLLLSYDVKQKQRRETAAMIHAAGALYMSNHPAGGWSDIGYTEFFGWDGDNPLDWRYVGDRLITQKLHEWEPGSTVQLYFMSRDYPLRVIAYNFVPNVSLRFGSHLPNALRAVQELVRARWYLREAKLEPIVLHPAAWHYRDTVPLETAVLSLPGTVYMPVLNHTADPVEQEFRADLSPVLDETPGVVWKATLIKGPWIRDHGRPVEGGRFGSRGYKFDDEKLEVLIRPLEGVAWDQGRLAFHDTIAPRSLQMHFVPTVPAIVRAVDGADVPWPVGSQPEIDIEPVAEGLRISCRRDQARLGIDPAFIDGPPPAIERDDLGMFPIEIARGEWLLTPAWKLVPETVHEITLQNSTRDYAGQINDQVSAGGWGDDSGYTRPGDLNQPDSIFVCRHAPPKQTYTAHTLLRFDLAGRLPEKVRPVSARLVIAVDSLTAAGYATLQWYPALKPWKDNETFWTGWGNGGREPGYLGEMIDETYVSAGTSEIDVTVPIPLLKRWVEQPASNHGLMVRMKEGNGAHLSLGGAASDNPPKLMVRYKEGG